MSQNSIILRFTYEKKEFVKAYKRHPFFMKVRIRDSILSLLAIAFGIYLWVAIEKNWIAIYLVLVGILLFALRFFLPQIAASRMWKLPKNQQEIFLEFSDEEIIYKTEGIDSKLKWSIFDSFIETPEAFLLLHSKWMFTLIPKRVLEQPEQLERFKQMLKTHAPTKKKS